MSRKQKTASRPDLTEAILHQVSEELLAGLDSIRRQDGWADTHLTEKNTSTWTTAVVLRELVKRQRVPENFAAAKQRIRTTRRAFNGYEGWVLDRFPQFSEHASVYVTADALLLMLVLHDDESGKVGIHGLQSMQNADGGWGVCAGDESRVRPTAWALGALVEAWLHPSLRASVEVARIDRGLRWLANAQNRVEDGGWGDVPSAESNVSATSAALLLLLDVLLLLRNRAEIPFASVNEDGIRMGLESLRRKGVDGRWQASDEECDIHVGDRYLGGFHVGGLGTIAVLRVFLRAQRAGFLQTEDPVFSKALPTLIDRCRKVNKHKGAWVKPAESGSQPVIWQSAAALEALREVEDHRKRLQVRVLPEEPDFERIVRRVRRQLRFWRAAALSLLAVLVVSALSPSLSWLGPIAGTFGALPALWQGIVLLVVGLTVEETYRLLVVPKVVRPLLNRWKQRDRSPGSKG